MSVTSPPNLSQANLSGPNLSRPNLSNLTNLRSQQEAAPVDPALAKAAEDMEGMFIDYMMQVMRQSVPTNDLDLDSPASRIYQSMLDSEYAKKAAHTGGVGLSDLIIAYMKSRGYNGERGQGSDALSTKLGRPQGEINHEGK